MFCPCVLCITVIESYVPYVMRRWCCFSDLENFEEIFGITFEPQVHMLQYCDHSRNCWIQPIQNNLFVAKICCGHQSNFIDWAGVILVWLFLVKLPFSYSNFHVVTPRTAGCGLCLPATYVSSTVTWIRALWYAVWCMSSWLVLGLWAIVPLI